MNERLNDGRLDGMDALAAHGSEKYKRVVATTQRLPPVITAVVHACDAVSIAGAVEAHRLNRISPVLVALPARLQEVARQNNIDITGLPIIASAHSHDSAANGVALVRERKAEALMKGSLHTDELMGAVVAHDGGLRTERRISHCFIMEVPGYTAPLIITDAAVNIAPTLEAKADIVQNAIDLVPTPLGSSSHWWPSCRRPKR